MKEVRRWLPALGDGLGLGLAAGFYVWILDGPRPADSAILQMTQPGLLTGLPSLLLITLGAGLGAAAVLDVSAAGRTWRARLSLASCGLYLACTTAALGTPAHALAAGSVLLGLTALIARADAPESGAVLITLHVGAFSTAVAFFEQWAWYRAGWESFVENLTALGRLWLGG